MYVRAHETHWRNFNCLRLKTIRILGHTVFGVWVRSSCRRHTCSQGVCDVCFQGRVWALFVSARIKIVASRKANIYWAHVRSLEFRRALGKSTFVQTYKCIQMAVHLCIISSCSCHFKDVWFSPSPKLHELKMFELKMFKLTSLLHLIWKRTELHASQTDIWICQAELMFKCLFYTLNVISVHKFCWLKFPSHGVCLYTNTWIWDL